MDLPSGVVTFLMTDVESSVRLWVRLGARAAEIMDAHEAVVARAVARHRGTLLKSRGEGDSTFSVFRSATNAVSAAGAVQAGLVEHAELSTAGVRVRIGVATGEAEPVDGDYRCLAANLCARLRSAAHPGQILVSEATNSLVGPRTPDGISLGHLGAHQLRGFEKPVEVFEARIPGSDSGFPPIRSKTPSRGNLPRPLTTFVGRRREVAALERALATSPLVTLTGMGGSGKSRLALCIGERAAQRMSDGVWWVALDGLEDPALLCASVAAAMGLQPPAAVDVRGALLAALRGRDALLILDGAERLGPACADLALAIAQECPSVRLLVTSRQPMGLYGEKLWPVPPMDLRTPPGEGRDPDSTAPLSEAAELFVARAALARSDFRPTQEGLRLIEVICRNLDGIPLAIELAAARVAFVSLPEIAEQVDRLLSFESTTEAGIAPRHRSLRAAIVWSHGLLDEEEQSLFRRLAVFRGPFGLEEARVMARLQAPLSRGAVSLIESLHRRSLLLAEPLDTVMGYRLLVPLRHYGMECLVAAGEESAARDAHLGHHLALSRSAEAALGGSAQASALRDLDTTHDDLLSALGWSLESGQSEAGLALASSVWRYWYLRGRVTEGIDILNRLLDAAPGSAPDPVRADALHALGTLAHYARRDEEARRWLTASLEMRRSSGPQRAIAATENNLGILAYQSGDVTEARRRYEAALAAARAGGDARQSLVAQSNLVMVAVHQGDYDLAVAAAMSVEQSARDAGDRRTELIARSRLARIASDRGDWPGALALFERCADEAREMADDRLLLSQLWALSDVARSSGDTTAARSYAERFVEMDERLSAGVPGARSWTLLGYLLLAEDEPDRAVDAFSRALTLTHSDEYGRVAGHARIGLAWAHLARARASESWAAAREALVTYETMGNRIRTVTALETCAAALIAGGEVEDGRRALGAASVVRGEMGTPRTPETESLVAGALQAAGVPPGTDAEDGATTGALPAAVEHVLSLQPFAPRLPGWP